MILTLTPNPCVDKTLFVDRFEAGARIRAERCTCIAGGKGNNVSRVLTKLGYPTRAMNLLGGLAGDHVLQMLRDVDGIDCISCPVGGMTRTITTVLEENSGRQTAFFEPGPCVAPEACALALERFTEQLSEANVVTLNGTVPDPIMVSLYRECITRATAAGIPVILDAHGPEFLDGLRASPFMIKPNLEEAADALGFPLADERDQWRAVDRFHALGAELVVLSRGENGMLVSRRETRFKLLPPRIDEVNPVGSGDALVAGFAIGLTEGWSLETTARFGAALGAANACSWDIGQFDATMIPALRDGCTLLSAAP